MNTTLLALLGFLCWTLLLLVLMELVRSKLVLTREVPASGFNPENSGLSPFMQRLARAHRPVDCPPCVDLVTRRDRKIHRLCRADGDRRVLGHTAACRVVAGP